MKKNIKLMMAQILKIINNWSLGHIVVPTGHWHAGLGRSSSCWAIAHTARGLVSLAPATTQQHLLPSSPPDIPPPLCDDTSPTHTKSLQTSPKCPLVEAGAVGPLWGGNPWEGLLQAPLEKQTSYFQIFF